MGSKGSAQTTQQQAGTSTYSANPLTQQAGSQALGMASNAANLPFQLPTQQYAGFTPDQLSAFQQTQGAAQSAQPYYAQAQGLYNQSAQPISASQISQYMDPYAGQVLANLKESQGQQMNDATGRLTQQAGGVGGDRIGVAQGELARQQSLATGQTLSGIYGNALSAAQQDAGRQQTAASGLGNLGNAAQNSGIQGASALYGMGANQQGLAQNQLNAQYQNQLAQVAFPYQQAQYLAGITGGLAGALGGTTNSNTNTQGTSTPAQPSIWSQLLGGATGLAGLYGATNGFGSNVGSMPATGSGSPTDAQSNAYAISQGINPFASGGAVGFADGGEVGISERIARSLHNGRDNGQRAFYNATRNGIYTSETTPADGGHPDALWQDLNTRRAAQGFDAQRIEDKVRGFAEGGNTNWMMADPAIPQIQMQPAQVHQPEVKFATPPQQAAQSSSPLGDIAGSVAKLAPLFLAQGGKVTMPFQGYAEGGDTGLDGDTPYRLAGPEAMNKWRRGVAEDVATGVNPNAAVSTGDTTVPENATYTSGIPDHPATRFGGSQAAQETAAANDADMRKATVSIPYKDLDHTSNTSRDFARSPWTALMNAGFGMMAGTSPFAGVNIGAGLQQGVKTLESQRTADREEETVNQRARQLALEADKHLRSYTQLTPAGAATIENQRKQRELEESKIEEAGWQKGGENTLTGDTTWFNPRSGESGLLKRDGTWQKMAASPAATPAAPGATPPAPGVTPPTAPMPPPPAATPPAAPAPAPYNVSSLGSNLEPGESGIGFIGKGSPMAIASTADIQATTKAQNKSAQQLPALQQDIAAMKTSYATLTKDSDKDGFLSRLALQPGASFGDRLEYAKKANALAAAAGEQPKFDPEKVAAAENINKIQARMGLTFSSQISPREAFAGQKIGIESTPGLTNSPQGFRRLLAGFEAAAENAKDEHTFFQNYLKKNGTSLGWRQDFEAKNPAERYIVKHLIGTLPEYNQKHLSEDVEALKKNPTPENLKLFNQHYADTASYFLNGRLQ